ncbi:MAG: P-loop NTPase [Gammaproteobacteria bacterium]|nr:P-loop NTPase [Gammaproteobacteria bacterium]
MHSDTQADSLRKSLQRKPSKVIAVCSGKGGVGKTNIASNIAVALGALGRDVCLLDADVSLANVDVLLGLQPRFNLSHVVSGEADLATTVLHGPNNIRIVPASSGNFCMTDLPAASQAAIIQAFSDLNPHPAVLVVDTAAGISSSVARFVQAAQHALVVVQDEPASLTDAYALIKVFSQNYGVSRFNIVTNRSAGATAGRALFNKLSKVADQFLDVVMSHIGDVPNDRYLVKAVQQQRAVVDAYPLSDSGTALLKIAKAIDQMADRRKPSGGIEFFFERLLLAEPTPRGKVA